MRKRFELQYSLGAIPIEETYINLKCRDASPKIALALVEIYKNKEYSEKIFKILEDNITKGKQKTGRPGMDLWQIFVFGIYRLSLDIGYDRLHDMANTNMTMRTLLGVHSEGFDIRTQYEFEYQNILDNVSLLNEELLQEINSVVIDFGHKIVFKKKRKPVWL